VLHTRAAKAATAAAPAAKALTAACVHTGPLTKRPLLWSNLQHSCSQVLIAAGDPQDVELVLLPQGACAVYPKTHLVSKERGNVAADPTTTLSRPARR
jgi:hypothetical protein